MTNMLSMHSKHANCEDDVGATVINLKQLLSPHHLNQTAINVEAENVTESATTSTTVTTHNVFKEKINCNARGFTAGYVLYKLCRWLKCIECKKNNDYKRIDKCPRFNIIQRAENFKKKNLKYPSTQFIVAFSEIINATNAYLERNCHKNGLVQNIKEQYLIKRDLEWLGCPTHKEIIKENFVKITTRLQIFNWCRGINLILGGKVQSKIKLENMNNIQKLAVNKYNKIKKYRCNKK